MTETRTRIAAMLLADSRLPSGAYAHSAGLEAATLSGLGLDAVPHYIEARLRTVAALDAAAAVLTRRAVGGPQPDILTLRRIDHALGARTPSETMRNASRQLGRGLLRLARSLVEADAGLLALDVIGMPFRAVALGAAGAALGLDDRGVASVACYDEAQAVASAALKLFPTDPSQSAAWVLRSIPLIESIVDDALDARDPDDLPSLTALEAEGWIHDHATERRRLFVS